MESSFFLSELAIAAIPSNRSDGSSILATWRVTRVRRVLVKLIFYKNSQNAGLRPAMLAIAVSVRRGNLFCLDFTDGSLYS